MSDETTQGPRVEAVEVEPSVSLVVVYGSDVAYQALVGAAPLASLLADIAATDGTPLEKQDQVLEVLGQDIYQTNDTEFVLGLKTAFASYMKWKNVKHLSQVFTKPDLTYAFIVSY